MKLQPRALEYVSLRLQGLDELQSLKASAPVDYLRGCAANLQVWSLPQAVEVHKLPSLLFVRVSAGVYGKCLGARTGGACFLCSVVRFS